MVVLHHDHLVHRSQCSAYAPLSVVVLGSSEIYLSYDGSYSLNEEGPPRFADVPDLVEYYKRTAIPTSSKYLPCQLVELKAESISKIEGVRFKKADTNIVPKLLETRDKAKVKELKETEKSLKYGMNANKVCDLFYQKYGDTEDWPNKTPNHKKFRDWLKKRTATTEGECETFCKEQGLTWSPP